MIYLMNSAVMPAGCYGTYICSAASIEDIKALVSGNLGKWESYLGYPQNAELIKRWTGYTPHINRDVVEFEDGDKAVVMRLKRRVAIGSKGSLVSENLADWEFMWVEYKKQSTL